MSHGESHAWIFRLFSGKLVLYLLDYLLFAYKNIQQDICGALESRKPSELAPGQLIEEILEELAEHHQSRLAG